MKSGIFIVFEGLDGSGKSTCAQRTAQLLGARHMRTPDGDLLEHRGRILNSFEGSQEAAQLLYLASVTSASARITKYLDAGESVVLDRYLLSTQVYAEFRGSKLQIEDAVAHVLRPADLTVFLDAPLDVRCARVRSRSQILPDDDAQTLVAEADSSLRRGYMRRLESRIVGRVLVLDSSSLTAERVAEVVADEIANLGGAL